MRRKIANHWDIMSKRVEIFKKFADLFQGVSSLQSFFELLCCLNYVLMWRTLFLANEAKLWSLIRYVLLAEVWTRNLAQDSGASEQRKPCQERNHFHRRRHGSVHYHVRPDLRRSAQWPGRRRISTWVREVPQHRSRQGGYIKFKFDIDRACNLTTVSRAWRYREILSR